MADIKAILKRKEVMYVYIALFVAATIYVAMLFYYSLAYGGKMYPNVYIGDINVSGMTKDEAKDALGEKVDGYSGKKIILKSEDDYKLNAKSINIAFDIDSTIDDAYEAGRDGIYNPLNKEKIEISPAVTINRKYLVKKIIEITKNENKAVQDAGVAIENGEIVVSSGKPGKRILFGENIEIVMAGIQNFENDFIILSRETNTQISDNEIAILKKNLENILSDPIILKDNGSKYTISEDEIASFITFDGDSDSIHSVVKKPRLQSFYLLSSIGRGQIIIDEEKIYNWAIPFASYNIDSEPVNAILGISGGKVVAQTSGSDGRKVKLDAFVGEIKNAVGEKNEITIPVKTTKPEIKADSIDKLGLKELVSRGYSDFTGSPQNRIHNIKNGASKIDGALIKPGDNFSFNKRLGPVEKSTGYLPELVILDDKTTPQYGGGLCQVSSTAFRAALNAGLPIIERLEHAYPVQYYKPYGVDATIYLPNPDLVFNNDTDGYIYIQTYISGYKLYFDFYGTKKEGSIKFAGNKAGTKGVSDIVEGVESTITEKGKRGKGSFTAIFYRFLYDKNGKRVKTNWWVSKYDSPDKYPH